MNNSLESFQNTFLTWLKRMQHYFRASAGTFEANIKSGLEPSSSEIALGISG